MIIGTDNKVWSESWQRLPSAHRDVFFMPQYYECWETDTIKARCFVCEQDHGTSLYPFLHSKSGSIYGPMGYNGVANPSVCAELTEKLKTWKRAKNITSEVTRFNPVLHDSACPSYLSYEHVLDNVVVDLSKRTRDIEAGFSKACRKNIKKANREKLTVRFVLGRRLSTFQMRYFYEVYLDTMFRRGAMPLPFMKLAIIPKKLPDNSLLGFVFDGPKIISTELVLFGERIAYSFLGGTLAEHFDKRPNNILKEQLIFRLKTMGLTHFILGGGKKKGDGIERYKQGFAEDGVVPFYCGRLAKE